MATNIFSAKIGVKRVFNVSDVEKLLNQRVARHDTGAVSSPPELNAIQLLPGMSAEDYVNVIRAGLANVKEYDVNVWRVGLLQLAGSLRITEALQIMPWHITLLGDVQISALKNGVDRLVKCAELSNWLIYCKLNSIVPFAGISRNYVWRTYNKCGLLSVLGGGKRHIVTHIFRHANASIIRDSGIPDTIISQELGHKSKKTQMLYGKT